MCTVAFAIASCSGDDNVNPIAGHDALIVKLGGAVVYSDDEVEWRMVPSLAAETPARYDLYMDGTRFMAMMPLLDMEVIAIENQHSQPEQHFFYENASVVPSIKGNPMPKYTLSNFRCEVIDWNLLKVSFSCKGCDVTYENNINQIY